MRMSQANITSIVNRLGRSVILRTYVNSGTAFDPTRTATDINVTAAVFDYLSGEIDGAIIKKDDKEIIISAKTTITKDNKIIDGAVEYNIESLEEVSPGNEKLMYIIQGRA